MSDLPYHELDLISQLPQAPLTSRKTLHLVSVYLYRSVDLITHSSVTHYPKGPALIPSDLTRLLYRTHTAIPLASVKRTLLPKQSRY